MLLIAEKSTVPSLIEFKQLAYRAYYWTSHSPERRGESFLREHEELLKADLRALPDEKHQDYTARFKRLVSAYLASHSNVASSFITGSANFPVARNRKKGEWADNKYRQFTEWRIYYFKKVEKESKKAAIAAAGGELEIAKRNLIIQTKYHEDMIAANKVIRKALKDNLTIGATKELLLPYFSPELIADILRPDYLGRIGFQTFSLTNSKARINNTAERIKTLEKRGKTAPQEVMAGDIRVVQNTPINRLQIFFPSKPDEATRHTLKHNGFRWSPTNGCWQAYNNNRSVEFAKSFIKQQNNS